MFSSPARRARLWPFALVAVVAVVIGLWFGGHPSWLPAPLRSVFVHRSAQEQQVDDVLALLSQEYYRPVDTQKLVNTGLAAAVASLNDPYSHYYPPAEYRVFLNETNPQVSGIGVEVNTVPTSRGLQIVEVYPGSPAARAGLVHGDIVTAVGSTELAGKSTTVDSRLIRGRAGTRVTLTVLHHGHTRRVIVVRANVVVPVAASQMLHFRGHRVGYLEFSQFAQGSAAELRSQLRRLLRAGAQGLILDLRANPGGLLEEAIKVASTFIPDGTIVTTRGRSQPTVVYTALPGWAIAPRIPMVVLVDRGTASSAEIVTAALKDRGRATVVGTRTYGKGVFQQIQDVPGGGALDITVGEYFTPDGQNLGAPGVAQGRSVAEGRGIAPNVYVYDNPQAPGTKALSVAERVLAGKLH
jgi:carboxyl-terminal processing protease